MVKRLKPIEWIANSIEIDFSAVQEQPLGWVLKAIIEYKAIPVDIKIEILSKIPIANKSSHQRGKYIRNA